MFTPNDVSLATVSPGSVLVASARLTAVVKSKLTNKALMVNRVVVFMIYSVPLAQGPFIMWIKGETIGYISKANYFCRNHEYYSSWNYDIFRW